MKKVEYSVVVPVYNGATTIVELFDRTKKVFHDLNASFEIIFVEDGGKDNSWEIIRSLYKQYPEQIVGVRLSKNYGQHNATFCGLDNASGQFIITIDDDLQTPPEEIKKLIQEYNSEKQPDAVYGFYRKKKHSRFRNLGSNILRKYINTFFGISQRGSSFRLFARDINQHMLNHKSTMVFVDELLQWYAGNITFTEVEHAEQKSGSGYSTIKLFRLFINIILYSTVTPLKIMIYGGFLIASFNFVIGMVFIYRKMIYNVPIGFTALIVAILFSTGILLFFLGIIGKYLGRIFVIQNQKPPYLIKRKLKKRAD
ncbi:MAG: glycosyltransferase family 2 protein [Bacteroidales bacterium]